MLPSPHAPLGPDVPPTALGASAGVLTEPGRPSPYPLHLGLETRRRLMPPGVGHPCAAFGAALPVARASSRSSPGSRHGVPAAVAPRPRTTGARLRRLPRMLPAKACSRSRSSPSQAADGEGAGAGQQQLLRHPPTHQGTEANMTRSIDAPMLGQGTDVGFVQLWSKRRQEPHPPRAPEPGVIRFGCLAGWSHCSPSEVHHLRVTKSRIS